ncbi:Galactose mutarotase related enzyme [Lunatimonas lonarensis]|uniref:Galactose mutarotase related enzyme n=1 Tax=Lunatimonas lonarensis TaxID=1232681 RepID=R7ZL34_9BACT|nr:aldose 1-epimerase family protein [Lunatimonas lonarensis]EON74798.1 Galactose mutarotase related enzyme [Lunatimonas lonarensis]
MDRKLDKVLLRSENRSAVIQPLGAELASYKVGEREYIWQALPSIWARHAPLLFPIVGRLKENQFSFQGKNYSLPQHGFARDRVFELVAHSATSASFLLCSDSDTLVNYPFDFELWVVYTLIEEGLEVSYRVINRSAEPMYFSIGAHPGFLCPLDPEAEQFSDYIMDFEDRTRSEVLLYPLEQGYVSTAKVPFSVTQGKVALREDMFDNDALIMDVFPPSRVSVRHKDTGRGFGMEFGAFKWLGIWSKGPGAGFICLEPWSGVADTIDHDGDLTRKLGIQYLNAKGQFSSSYQMFFW